MSSHATLRTNTYTYHYIIIVVHILHLNANTSLILVLVLIFIHTGHDDTRVIYYTHTRITRSLHTSPQSGSGRPPSRTVTTA